MKRVFRYLFESRLSVVDVYFAVLTALCAYHREWPAFMVSGSVLLFQSYVGASILRMMDRRAAAEIGGE